MTIRTLFTLVLPAPCAAPVRAGFEEGSAAYERGGRWPSSEIPRPGITWGGCTPSVAGCLETTSGPICTSAWQRHKDLSWRAHC